MSLQEKVLQLIPYGLRIYAQETFDKYMIHTVLRCSHFLAQIIHESGGFRFKEENLNYSKSGLLLIFGKYFNEQTAKEYEYKPEMIANKVYANRMGNGNEQSGDGWKYRGRGFIQITGKANYMELTEKLQIDFLNNPDLLTQDRYAMLSAGWFWNERNLNLIADQGSDNDTIVKVTRRINGGVNNITDRIKIFNEIYNKITR